ncbi:MAG: sulfatase family protein [Promethearchaeota archaeon]
MSKIQSKYPNIIFIILHDAGDNFQCYGSPIETPNIDRIATNGIKFTNHFCTAPQCTPSRGSILTGKMPHSNGLMGLTNRGWNLPEKNQTLPQLLSQNGYSTHLLGLQHTHKDAMKLGYETISPRKDFPYMAKTVARRFKKFFTKVNSGDISEPFFCSIGFFEAHRPFYPLNRNLVTPIEDVIVPPELPDTPEIRKSLSNFEGLVREADQSVGKILDTIENSAMSDNTLIVFTVDHGWAFPRAKCTLYDKGLKTALLMSYPEIIPKRVENHHLLSNVDLFPTILDFAGIEPPASIQSRSFKPLILGEKYLPRNQIYAEMTHHGIGFNPIRGIRTDKWKYIKNFAPLSSLFEIPKDIIDEDDGKSYIKENKSYSTPRPDEELYNLIEDSREMNNLAEDKKYSSIKEELEQKLMQFLERTEDPLLKGEIKAPPMPDSFFKY